jgi:protein-L-isoaspartate O-methyltransferase
VRDWNEAARKLAEQITATAPEWHDAVCATPRHVLVPRWWEAIPDSYPFAWGLVTAELGGEVYTDDTLVTRVGALHADHAQPGDRAPGLPTSSSTLPGLIVRMLHLLDPQPDHQVLDVGTGSGYSAALLSHRLGDERVTSIDVDAYLVEAARERLASLGQTPRVEVADATGELPDGRYDKIMATVSVRPVPRGWLEALQPGGRIITTIVGTSLLVSADMGDEGIARGRILADPANFMRTRQAPDYPPRLDLVYDAARDADGDDVRRLDAAIPDLWTDWSLHSLFELDSPDIENRSATLDDGSEIVWLLGDDGSWARAEGANQTVHQSGRRRLWDDLERVQRRWAETGRFAVDQLRVTLAPEKNTLTSPDGSWSFTV